MTARVILRDMRPEDSPALVSLIEAAPPEQKAFGLTTRFLVDPYTAWHRLRPDMMGVVAERPETCELVGMATVAFDPYCIEGQNKIAAFLGNLKVHHNYRQQGIGTQLAEWRIAAAQERYGSRVVILSATTSDNAASLAIMKKRGSQMVGPLVVAPHLMASQAPDSIPGITIRSALDIDLPTVVRKAEHFYEGYRLFPAYSVDRLRQLLRATAPVYHYRVAVNNAGDLLAGVLIANRANLMVDELPRGTASIIPGEQCLRTGELAMFWYTDLAAGRALWQHIRWEFRAQINTFSVCFDPKSGLSDVFQIDAAYSPQFALMVSISHSLLANNAKPVSMNVRS